MDLTLNDQLTSMLMIFANEVTRVERQERTSHIMELCTLQGAALAVARTVDADGRATIEPDMSIVPGDALAQRRMLIGAVRAYSHLALEISAPNN